LHLDSRAPDGLAFQLLCPGPRIEGFLEQSRTLWPQNFGHATLVLADASLTNHRRLHVRTCGLRVSFLANSYSPRSKCGEDTKASRCFPNASRCQPSCVKATVDRISTDVSNLVYHSPSWCQIRKVLLGSFNGWKIICFPHGKQTSMWKYSAGFKRRLKAIPGIVSSKVP
jgi:hypothetical protein